MLAIDGDQSVRSDILQNMFTRRFYVYCLILLITVSLQAVAVKSNFQGEVNACFIDNPVNYPQGSICEIQFKSDVNSPVRFSVDGLLEKIVGSDNSVFTYSIDTAMLRQGKYKVMAELMKGDFKGRKFSKDIQVCKPHDKNRMPLWTWGNGSWKKEWFMQHGFVGGFTNQIKCLPDEGSAERREADRAKQQLELSAMLDYDYGVYLSPMRSPILKADRTIHKIFPDGLIDEDYRAPVYPLEPKAIEYSKKVARYWSDFTSKYPAWRHVMLSSEYHRAYCTNKIAKDTAKAEAGIDIEEFIAVQGKWHIGELTEGANLVAVDGVVPDDHPRYKFMKWFRPRGLGLSSLNAVMSEEIKNIRPDLLTWHDPYRDVGVRGTHKGLDVISTWTYGYPDIKRLCYTNYLQGAAKPFGQKVMQTITLWLYGHFVIPLEHSTADFERDFPGRDPYFVAGSDYATEALWIVFSQRPDIMCVYSSGALMTKMFDPNISERELSYTSPETWEAIGDFAGAVQKPLGPALLQCKRLENKVALYNSVTGLWFGESTGWGYGNEKTLPYATLLVMNHVPFDVVMDDDVSEGALSNYGTVIIPLAQAFSQTNYEKLQSFIQNGGRVIANKPVKAKFDKIIETDFDFSYQKNLTGRINQKDRITAEQCRTTTESYAKQLSTVLSDMNKPAWSSSMRVICNSLIGNDVKYHFFINDNRGYGDRFGKWKLFFEKVLPLKAKGYVKFDGGVLYNVLTGQKVGHKKESDYAEFPVEFAGAEGKIIAHLPEEISGVHIKGPRKVARLKSVQFDILINGVSGKKVKGIMPLKLKVVEPDGKIFCSGYSSTKHALDYSDTFEFTAAANEKTGKWSIEVEELITHKTQQYSFDVVD